MRRLHARRWSQVSSAYRAGIKSWTLALTGMAEVASSATKAIDDLGKAIVAISVHPQRTALCLSDPRTGDDGQTGGQAVSGAYSASGEEG